MEVGDMTVRQLVQACHNKKIHCTRCPFETIEDQCRHEQHRGRRLDKILSVRIPSDEDHDIPDGPETYAQY